MTILLSLDSTLSGSCRDPGFRSPREGRGAGRGRSTTRTASAPVGSDSRWPSRDCHSDRDHRQHLDCDWRRLRDHRHHTRHLRQPGQALTIDFEFIALNELKNTPAATTFVVDPGVVRHFDAFALGLRLATQVGSPTNVGLVPIFVVPFRISSQFSYFVEGDIPLFLRDTAMKVEPSLSFLFQTGVGF